MQSEQPVKPGDWEEIQQPAPAAQPAPQAADSKLTEVFVGIVRWLAYSALMLVLLVPWLQGWRLATGCMLLGHFSGQLNKIANSLKQ